MKGKKLFSPSKTRAQETSQQIISGEQTDQAKGKISLGPIGLQGGQPQRMDLIQGELLSKLLPNSSPDSRCFCILIVENDQSLSAMLEEALASWGCEVRVARNGQEGLALLGIHFVDAILLDLQMPVMDGRTMLDELRWAGHTIPVWMMSGGLEARALRSLRHEGAQGFLIKPFGLLALRQVLGQMINLQQQGLVE